MHDLTHDRDVSTTIVDRYRDAAHLGGGANNYRGLRIHALAGLHDCVGSLAREHLRPGGSVLDVAAGSGAMSLRLRDLGFDVVATDYVAEGFRLHGDIEFRQANLNEPFAPAFDRRFDGIVASEIIEHLENPRHFTRELFRLLKPGGRLILSTPNIDSMASKAMFLSAGTFLWFGEQQYMSDGHIMPLSQFQLRKVFTEAGFRFVVQTSFGDARDRLAGSPRLLWLVRLLDRAFTQDRTLNGEIFVAVLEKPAGRDA